ncbi:NAD-dependent epimerase/dehydratase family protein [Chloroflexota bacterium]
MSQGKVLVTGAPGWLGTRFVEILAEKNRDIRCLVLPGIDVSHLKKLGADIVQGNITKPESLEKVADGVETVFHIVGIIHVKFFGVSSFYRINTEGTKNMLECAIKAGVKRFIYVSSNSVSGCNYDGDALMNEYTPPRPYMTYGKSKFLSERAVNEASVRGEIETVIFRPCWFYGPAQPARQTRLMKMIKNGNVPLFGDGSNLRSMTYIDNLCEALLLAEEMKTAKGETYWIADERPYSTLEIYETIAELLEVKLKTTNIPGFFSDIGTVADWIMQKLHIYQQEIHVVGELNKNIACSIEKAKKDLGYKPNIDLREGMKRSIEWAKERGLL